MRRHLFDHVNLSPRRIHFLNGAARDVAARMRALRARDRARRRHRPADPRARRERPHRLQRAGARAGRAARIARASAGRRGAPTRCCSSNRVGAVPREALSMGMATILQRAADRAGRDRGDQGALRGADDRGAGDAAAAGVVPAAAPRRRGVAGPSGGGASTQARSTTLTTVPSAAPRRPRRSRRGRSRARLRRRDSACG